MTCDDGDKIQSNIKKVNFTSYDFEGSLSIDVSFRIRNLLYKIQKKLKRIPIILSNIIKK